MVRLIKKRVGRKLVTSPVLEQLQELEQRIQEKHKKIDAEKAKKETTLKKRI